MSETIRELLTELAWIEDSIRHLPMDGGSPDDAHVATAAINPDLVVLAEREAEIIAELRGVEPHRDRRGDTKTKGADPSPEQ